MIEWKVDSEMPCDDREERNMMEREACVTEVLSK